MSIFAFMKYLIFGPPAPPRRIKVRIMTIAFDRCSQQPQQEGPLDPHEPALRISAGKYLELKGLKDGRPRD